MGGKLGRKGRREGKEKLTVQANFKSSQGSDMLIRFSTFLNIMTRKVLIFLISKHCKNFKTMNMKNGGSSHFFVKSF